MNPGIEVFDRRELIAHGETIAVVIIVAEDNSISHKHILQASG